MISRDLQIVYSKGVEETTSTRFHFKPGTHPIFSLLPLVTHLFKVYKKIKNHVPARPALSLCSNPPSVSKFEERFGFIRKDFGIA